MDEHSTPPDEAGSADDADNDVATLRALALALLVYYSRGPQADDEPQLQVGRLPADLPFTLPLIEGSQLLGTLLSGNPLVVLESELAPDAVISWYEKHLPAAGWRQLPAPVQLHAHVGFVPAAHAEHAAHVEMLRPPFAAFVLGEDGPGLGVEAFAGPSGRTVARVSVHRDGATAFSHIPIRHLQGHDPWSAMPALVPPPGVQHWDDGASGSTERIQLNGRVQTDLDLAMVAAGYTAQLEQRGWQQQDAGISGPVAWSRWSFGDRDGEPWSGQFVILERAGGRGWYWVHLVGERVGTPRSGTSNGSRLLGWQVHTVSPSDT